MIRRRRKCPEHVVVDHDSIGPEVVKGTVECAQGGENSRGVAGGSSDYITVGNDLIL